jgi:hypothetical protein
MTSSQDDAELAMQLLREHRTRLLAASDYSMAPDYPHPSPDVVAAWVTYRQLLRDLPSVSTPSLNADRTLRLDSVQIPPPPS